MNPWICISMPKAGCWPWLTQQPASSAWCRARGQWRGRHGGVSWSLRPAPPWSDPSAADGSAERKTGNHLKYWIIIYVLSWYSVIGLMMVFGHAFTRGVAGFTWMLHNLEVNNKTKTWWLPPGWRLLDGLLPTNRAPWGQMWWHQFFPLILCIWIPVEPSDQWAEAVYNYAAHVRLCHATPTTVWQKQGNHCSVVFPLHALSSALADQTYCAHIALSWFQKEVAGLYPLIVLTTQMGLRIVNNPMETTRAVTAQTLHPSNTACSYTVIRHWALRHAHIAKLYTLTAKMV